MKRVNYFNTQLVLADDLNYGEVTKLSQSVYRTQAPLGNSGGYGGAYTYQSSSVVKGGVYGSPADYALNTNLKVELNDSETITFHPGTALTPAGDLIRITSPVIFSISTVDSSKPPTYRWIADTNKLMYASVQYQEKSSSLRIDDYGNSHYPYIQDSYYCLVSSTIPDSSSILLATFTSDSYGYANVSSLKDRRTYVRTITPANAVILDPTTKPYAGWTSVEDHVNAVGTGVVSAVNPHGLSLDDLTAGTFNLKEHIQSSHANGIIVNDSSAAALQSWEVYFIDDVTIGFYPPVNATASINGVGFTGNVNNYVVDAEGGDFIVATDSSGNVTAFPYNSSAFLYETNSPYLPLAFIEVDPLTLKIISYSDERIFKQNTQNQIRVETTEGITSPSIALNTKDHSLVTNLNRIRYQLGLAINGTTSSTAWKTSSPPLTSGASSIADAYHTHQTFYENQITFNNNNVYTTDPYLRWRVAFNTYVAFQWSRTNSRFELYSDLSALTKASLLIGPNLTIGSTLLTETNLNILIGGGTSNADALHNHSRTSSTSFTIDYDSVSDTSKELRFQKTATLYHMLKWNHAQNRFELISNYGEDTDSYSNLLIGKLEIDGISLTSTQLGLLTAGSSSLASSLHTHYTLNSNSVFASGSYSMGVYYRNNSSIHGQIATFTLRGMVVTSNIAGLIFYVGPTTGSVVQCTRLCLTDYTIDETSSCTFVIPPLYYWKFEEFGKFTTHEFIAYFANTSN